MIIATMSSHAQSFSVETLLFLPEKIQETSGIVFLNDRVVTHNDSGGEPVLYEIEPESGEITREVTISNGTNIDWEDLAFDQQYIYIGDIGNNNGDRTDLRIYRLAISDYFQSSDDLVSVDTIRFEYHDQIDFSGNPFTNFDAEALISLGDSLYIFTKNWGDQHTNIYSLPKEPGDYQAKRVGRINTSGLITSAVYNILSQEVMLTGYTITGPFIFRIADFDPIQLNQAKTNRLFFDIQGSFQIEAIEAINESEYLLTSESSDLGDAKLLRLNTDFVVATGDLPDTRVAIFPNPATRQVKIAGIGRSFNSIAIIDLMGREQSLPMVSWTARDQISLDLDGFPSGVYQVVITAPDKKYSHRLIVKTLD